ncbi:hypothetical protein DIPPA_25430 [Diplonema papillatum]|nr:hypothetical protein DIPPA_25430 [Diplonema papillatum]
MLNPLQLSGVCVTHDAQQRSEVLLAALRGSTLAAKVKRELKDEVIKNKYTAASFSGSTALAALMDSMRLTAKLNAGVACLQSDIARALSRSHTHGVPIPVSNTESHHSDTPHQQQQQQHHHHHQVYPPVPTPDETLESVLRGRREWREKLAARVKRLSVELDAPLARLRTPRTEAGRQAREKEDREAVNLCTFIDSQQQAAKLGADSDAAGTGPKSGKPGAPKQAPVRCIREDGSIFNAALLYAHVVGMRPSNHAFEAAKFSGWSVIKHELDTPSIDDLCKLYDDMKPSYRQCGVDDASNERFYDNTTKLFRGALARGDVASVRSLARRGVPVALRQLVWRTLLEPTLAHDQSTKEKVRLSFVYAPALYEKCLRRLPVATDQRRKCVAMYFLLLENPFMNGHTETLKPRNFKRTSTLNTE